MDALMIDSIRQVFARGAQISYEGAHDDPNGSGEGRVAASQDNILHINAVRGGQPDDIAAVGQRLTIHRVTPTNRYTSQALRIENAVPGGLTVKILTSPNKIERREYLRVRCQLPFHWRQVHRNELIGYTNTPRQISETRQQLDRLVRGVADPQAHTVLVAMLERLTLLEDKVERVVKRMQENGFLVEDIITELSGGGMRFLTRRRIRVGDIIEAVIAPDEDEVCVQARVLRIHPPNLGRAQPSIACRFITISPRDREVLIRAAFRIQRELLRRSVG